MVDRARLVPVAAVASLASLALLGVWLRGAPGGDLGWMAWNLLLGWIPLALGLAILRAARGATPSALIWPAVAAWVLFLPNAPYMLTDLIHLRGREGGQPLLDLAMLSAFALTGLVLFVASVLAVREAALLRLGGGLVRVVVPGCIWLSSAGIYLGRVLRWNSWDVVGDPVGRAGELVTHLADPMELIVAITFMAGIGVCLHLAWAAASRVVARLPGA